MGQAASTDEPEAAEAEVEILPEVAARFRVLAQAQAQAQAQAGPTRASAGEGGEGASPLLLDTKRLADVLAVPSHPEFAGTLVAACLRRVGVEEAPAGLTLRQYARLYHELSENAPDMVFECFARPPAEGDETAPVLDKPGASALLSVLEHVSLSVGFVEAAAPSGATETASAAVASLVQSLWVFAARGKPTAAEAVTSVTCDTLEEWAAHTAPTLFGGFRAWAMLQCVASDQASYLLPAIANPAGGRVSLTHSRLWQLSTMLPGSYMRAPELTLLYNSREDGRSANRFQHHCFKYRGPTMTLISTRCGRLLGSALSTEWRESERPYGGPDGQLFALDPVASTCDADLVYGNTKSRHAEHGIGFGAHPESLKTADLWLAPDFSTGQLRFAVDVPRGTYADFDITSVEVWGCGDATVADAQKQERNRDRRIAIQNQKVKLPGQWDDGGRALLEMAGVGAVNQSRIDVSKRE